MKTIPENHDAETAAAHAHVIKIIGVGGAGVSATASARKDAAFLMVLDNGIS